MGNCCPLVSKNSMGIGKSTMGQGEMPTHQISRINNAMPTYQTPNYYLAAQKSMPTALDKRVHGIPSNLNNELVPQQHSTLQHIAEREPDDTEMDPTMNVQKETLFWKSSCRDVELSIRKRRSYYDKSYSRRFQNAYPFLHRSSSTSTVMLDDSTVTRPNGKSTIKALSLAVYLQIKNRDTRLWESPDIFDERLHPVQSEPLPDDYAYRDPDQKTVFKFIRCLFQNAQLSPECAIVSLVYLERLLSSAELELTPCNWKRIVLCAILLASKVWDDQAVWNVDYCTILRDLNVDDVNELERQYLEIIQFNINVPASVYAKYYFDIKSLSETTCQPYQLSFERAHKLEAYSRCLEDPTYDLIQRCANLRRCMSLDALQPQRIRVVILS